MRTLRRWWLSDPAVVACDLCGCPIQTTAKGTVADGMRLHFQYVHPGQVFGNREATR